MAAAMYARYKTNPQTMVPYADTPRTLRALRAHGISIGIVSNTGWNIREGYQRAGLEALIDVFVLSHEHGAAKPDPVLIARACRELESARRRPSWWAMTPPPTAVRRPGSGALA